MKRDKIGKMILVLLVTVLGFSVCSSAPDDQQQKWWKWFFSGASSSVVTSVGSSVLLPIFGNVYPTG